MFQGEIIATCERHIYGLEVIIDANDDTKVLPDVEVLEVKGKKIIFSFIYNNFKASLYSLIVPLNICLFVYEYIFFSNLQSIKFSF